MKMQYVRFLIIVLLLLTSIAFVTTNAVAQTFPQVVPGWGKGDVSHIHIGPPPFSIFPTFPPRPTFPPKPTFPPIPKPSFPPRPSLPPHPTFPPFPTIPPQPR